MSDDRPGQQAQCTPDPAVIRVFLLDDHEVVRRGVRWRGRPDMC